MGTRENQTKIKRETAGAFMPITVWLGFVTPWQSNQTGQWNLRQLENVNGFTLFDMFDPSRVHVASYLRNGKH